MNRKFENIILADSVFGKVCRSINPIAAIPVEENPLLNQARNFSSRNEILLLTEDACVLLGCLVQNAKNTTAKRGRAGCGFHANIEEFLPAMIRELEDLHISI